MDTAPNEKPKAPIIGADGNIYNTIAIARKALAEAGKREEANALLLRISKEAKSYDEALNIVMEYVEPVSVYSDEDEDDEFLFPEGGLTMADKKKGKENDESQDAAMFQEAAESILGDLVGGPVTIKFAYDCTMEDDDGVPLVTPEQCGCGTCKYGSWPSDEE